MAATCCTLGLILTLTLTLLSTCQGDKDDIYRVTTIVHEPYLMVRNVTDAKGDAQYEGFIVDLLDAIADYADFKYDLELVEDKKWGQKESNGRWSGMIGELVHGDTDIAAAPVTITAARRDVVDFAYPFQPVTLTAIMKHDIDISSIEELANQTEVNYGTFDGGATQKAFSGATLPMHRRMWKHMTSQKHSPFIRDMEEGLKRVREEDFAFIVERPMGEYVVNQEPCDLKMVGRFTTDNMPRSYAFALPKDHELTSDINAAMLYLQEDLSIAKLHRKWWPDLCMESAAGASSATTTTMLAALGFLAFHGLL